MTTDIKSAALACRDAAVVIAALDSAAKNDLLLAMAAKIETNTGTILTANAEDMRSAQIKGINAAMLDRFREGVVARFQPKIRASGAIGGDGGEDGV